MNYRITKVAYESIESITLYLKNEVAPKSASNFIRKLEDKIDLILNYPEIGNEVARNKNKVLRKVMFSNYVLYYYVDDKECIQIVNILHYKESSEKLIHW